MSRLLYLMLKLVPDSGGYGMLYNWPCTQIQAAVEYGYLYNWYAVTDSRNICSSGWHIPSQTELQTLETYLGGNTVAGGHLKEAGTTYWNSPNTGADNSSGFNSRGAGIRSESIGSFSVGMSEMRIWATTTLANPYQYSMQITTNTASSVISGTPRKAGISARPIKDSTTLTNGQSGTYVDPSGIIYPTVCIGTQEWVACNIMTKHYRNGDAIPEVTDNTAWAALTTGARCSYNNLESNAGNTKKLSSSDNWKIPIYPTNITSLIQSINPSDTITSNTVARNLRAIGNSHWDISYSDGLNSVGFNAGGSGVRNADGSFSYFKQAHYFHAEQADSANDATHRVISIFYNNLAISQGLASKNIGVSIHLCDPATTHANGFVGSYTQNDGTVIPTIVINGVEWTMNLRETKWSDGTDIQNITDNTAWSLLQSAACCDINNDVTKR